ncbi:hypothetical protein EDEG_03488 [Edhazardia aedis USNM 41457]|uniref:Guanylate cyclase domain-containing protein n=1 Tax=Edhazardia aedis (strain USNM 41457) TaxID=1003232 RepID=J9D3E9_EDHAE|nr:hypothetical protein EDEG_03488 [Edhazardia aedis USNM 41457]|eukprot:EJW02064.1 hypothetical protein EDEG_03488 [Edhazardia aedis USNM 41457]
MVQLVKSEIKKDLVPRDEPKDDLCKDFPIQINIFPPLIDMPYKLNKKKSFKCSFYSDENTAVYFINEKRFDDSEFWREYLYIEQFRMYSWSKKFQLLSKNHKFCCFFSETENEYVFFNKGMTVKLEHDTSVEILQKNTLRISKEKPISFSVEHNNKCVYKIKNYKNEIYPSTKKVCNKTVVYASHKWDLNIENLCLLANAKRELKNYVRDSISYLNGKIITSEFNYTIFEVDSPKYALIWAKEFIVDMQNQHLQNIDFCVSITNGCFANIQFNLFSNVLTGQAVNKAARMQNVSSHSKILLDKSAYVSFKGSKGHEYVEDLLGIYFESEGAFKMKGFLKPVEVFGVFEKQ